MGVTRARAASTAFRMRRAEGSCPVPLTSQSRDAPSAAASFRAVSASGRGRSPVSMSRVCPCPRPANRSSSRALIPALLRRLASRMLSETVMTTCVLVSAQVVKEDPEDRGDTRCQARHSSCVNELLERINYILALRAEDGKPMSLRALARAAGLAETHLGTFVKRLRDRPNAQIEVDTLIRIAKAADVDARWLATGEGSPLRHVRATETGTDPHRALAVEVARQVGASETAIAWAMTLDPKKEQPASWWLARIMSRHELDAIEQGYPEFAGIGSEPPPPASPDGLGKAVARNRDEARHSPPKTPVAKRRRD